MMAAVVGGAMAGGEWRVVGVVISWRMAGR